MSAKTYMYPRIPNGKKSGREKVGCGGRIEFGDRSDE
jgi:hypothetical protein